MNMMKYMAPCLVLTLIGPQMSEWTIYNGLSALITLPNGFQVAFSTRQLSQIGKSISVSEPNRPSLANLFILSCHICPSLACQVFTSTLEETFI